MQLHINLIVYQWWRDVVRERTFQGCHTLKVTGGLRWGMLLFIVSEIFFFFYLFFESLYFSNELKFGTKICMNKLKSGWPIIEHTLYLARAQSRHGANIRPGIIWSLQGKSIENHHCEKFPQENYNREDTIHSNRSSESSMALEEEED